jgi:peptidoglycan/LPS O-acetylase OafA/YrhL
MARTLSVVEQPPADLEPPRPEVRQLDQRRIRVIGDVSDSRDNNFDVLRLAAALLVLVSHSFALTQGSDPVADATGETLGTTGLAIFFAISGFLIARSFLLTTRVRDYAAKRALRLLPALWVVVLFTAFVIGPLYTTLSLGDYLTHPDVWWYVARSFFLDTVGGTLPGVFEHNVEPNAVNGSLWTLPVEAACYVMIAVLGALALLVRRWALPLIYVVLLAIISPVGAAKSLGTTTTGAELTSAFLVVAIFVGGAMLYVNRDRIPLRWELILPPVLAWALLRNSEWVAVITAVTIPYAVLLLAYRTPRGLRRLTAPGDVSYGLYLYAFPVQQSIVDSTGGIAPGAMFALSLPITYALALGSWRLIELPALRRKPGRSRS